MNHKPAATFVATLLHSATVAHLMHLQTKSYATHVALGDYYDAIVGLVDKYAEAYQGCYAIIDEYPATFPVAKEPKGYFKRLYDFVDAARKTLPKESHLDNIADEISELIDSTRYKLNNLS